MLNPGVEEITDTLSHSTGPTAKLGAVFNLLNFPVHVMFAFGLGSVKNGSKE